MKIHSDLYISKCIEQGILTSEVIHKYPLRSANLSVVLKAYANANHLPYTIDTSIKLEDTLYLTDYGWEWLHNIFKGSDFNFLRYTYQFVFSLATPEDVADPNYMGYGNFKGVRGEKPKRGTKQPAVLVQRFNKCRRTYRYACIRDARAAIFDLTRFYPVDSFKLYRVRTRKGSTYLEEIPVLTGIKGGSK